MRIIIRAGDTERVLRLVADRMRNLRPVLGAAGQYMLGSIQRNFDSEGRPRKWKPLSPATLMTWVRKRKTWVGKRGLTAAGRRALAGRKILTDTGRLRNSINYRAEVNRLIIGTNVSYAPYHQFGTKKMPARPFLLFQNEDIVEIRRMIADYLDG